MRIFCVVSYNGTNFVGWQSQQNGRSVQDEIEKVLERIHGKKIRIHGSGRTDGKVHAVGQTFNFDTDKDLSLSKWKYALNTMLPQDIHIVSCHYVYGDIHAQYSAISKEYHYYLNMGPYDVFQKDLCYQLNRSLDLEKMRSAAKIFVGTHDFTSFNATPLSLQKNQVRTIFSIDIIDSKDLVQFVFKGTGFLRYMVRMIVQTLIEIGLGRLDENKAKEWLEAKDKNVCRYNAKPEGLYLYKVNYNFDYHDKEVIYEN